MKEGWVNINTLHLHFVEWGTPGRPTLLLLHGVRGNARIWDLLAHELEGPYRLIALDQRGFGDSQHPTPPAYHLSDYLADLEGFVNALGLGPFVLAGHSMGALHALAYAASHPLQVQGLIYVDIAPRPPDSQRQFLQEAGARPIREFTTLQEALEVERRISPGLPQKVLEHLVVNNLSRQKDGKWRYKFDREALRHFDQYDLWPLVPLVSCPALIVRGSQSDVMGEGAAKEMVRQMPRARLVEVPGARHLVFLDQPQAFASAVQGFLLGLPLAL